jgi:penicillin-binding protein 2
MRKFQPGVSFGDFVISDSKTRKSLVGYEVVRDFRRGWLVWIGVVIGLVILIIRLATLQIFHGERYRLLSDQNRIQIIKLTAPRGIIYDRNDQILAGNTKVVSGIGKDMREIWQRIYPAASSSAHVVGYTGEIGEEEVGLLKGVGNKYDIGDSIGRSGIEAQYEDQLRGVDGGRLVEVDSQGAIARELGRREPIPGQDLHLTVDKDLQDAGLLALGDKKGALVVSDPNTGEILALVSSPSFDPNEITSQYSQFVVQPDLPLFNRAIGGIYPPGSTFKMTVTAAAITEDKVKPGFIFNDQGIIRVGSYAYTNWLYSRGGGTEGPIGFARAITRSTDTFFYTVGGMTGPEILAAWAHKFGLGDKTNIDIPGEVEGVIPDPVWKEKTKGEKWFLGNTYQMAIGQGDVLVTPIQLNLMTNVVATGGKKCQMHLTQVTNFKSQISNDNNCTEVQIAKEAVDIIHKGMVGACNPGGTAFPIFDWNEAALKDSSVGTFARKLDGKPLPLIACKTGTAEYVAADGKTREHGWLTAYAPADDPKISVTVLMEGGGEGSNIAAPVVRKLMAVYFGVEDKYPYSAIPQVVGE